MENPNRETDEMRSIIELVIKLNCPKLNLSGVNMRLEDIEYLAKRLINSSIKVIYLRNCSLGDDELILISSVLKYTNITHIDLSYNDFGFDGLLELAFALQDSKILNLNLSKTNLDEYATKILAKGLVLSGVIDLNVSGNNIISFGGCKTVADRLEKTQIINLDLSGCSLESLSTEYLSNKLKSCRIQKLNLTGNILGLDGAKSLANIIKNTSIKHLNLICCNVDTESAKYLASGLKNSAIEYLYIGSNKLMSAGCLSIGNIIGDTQITELDLSYNGIESSGIKLLANNLKKSKLKKLRLSQNIIKDDGADELAKGIENSDIELLDLSYNQLSGRGLSVMLNAVMSSKVTDFLIDNNKMKIDDAKVFANTIKLYNNIPNLNLSGCFESSDVITIFMNEFISNNVSKSNIDLGIFIDLNNFNIDQIKIIFEGLKYTNTKKLRMCEETFNLYREYDVIAYVSESLKTLKVSSIEFSFIHLRSEYMSNLINSIKHRNIYVLELNSCDLNDEQAEILADNLQYLNLETLDISWNLITDSGIISIANGLKQSRLTDLKLEGNNYTENGVEAIENALKDFKLLITLVLDDEFKEMEDSIILNNKLYFLKAESLVECFKEKVSVECNEEFREYYESFELFQHVDELWKNVENSQQIKEDIKRFINYNFFKIVGVMKSNEKRYFNAFPPELLTMICSHLSISDIL